MNTVFVCAEIQHLHKGSRNDAVKAVRSLYPAAEILTVDEEPFIGFCEVCREPLWPESGYRVDSSDPSVKWCRSHDTEKKNGE